MRPKNNTPTCSIEGCDRPHHARGWCGLHYERWRVLGDPHWRSQTTEDRFWSRVDTSGECWNWIGQSRNKGGYGQMFFRGRNEGTHRVAWMLTHGDIPDGLWVLHHCDNPLCCNPDHLYLGTHADNTRDLIRRNRQTLGARNPMAKLTEAQALEMRRLHESGTWTPTNLAKRYNVCVHTIHNVLSRRTWKHV